MTREAWETEGRRRFGDDNREWLFACPCCGHIASAHDYKRAGAPEGAVAFSCVGRWAGAKREAFGDGPGPCNYAGGGLLGMNPITITNGEGVVIGKVFAFAPEVLCACGRPVEPERHCYAVPTCYACLPPPPPIPIAKPAT